MSCTTSSNNFSKSVPKPCVNISFIISEIATLKSRRDLHSADTRVMEGGSGAHFNSGTNEHSDFMHHHTNLVENNLSNASWETTEYLHERLYDRARKQFDPDMLNRRSWKTWSKSSNTLDAKSSNVNKRLSGTNQKQRLESREPKSKKRKHDGGFQSSLVLKR